MDVRQLPWETEPRGLRDTKNQPINGKGRGNRGRSGGKGEGRRKKEGRRGQKKRGRAALTMPVPTSSSPG